MTQQPEWLLAQRVAQFAEVSTSVAEDRIEDFAWDENAPLLFVAAGQAGIKVFALNKTHVSNSQFRGLLGTGGPVWGVDTLFVDNELYLFVASGGEGVFVFHVEHVENDVPHLELLSRVQLGGGVLHINAVKHSNGSIIAYVAAGLAGVRILDFSDIEAPVELPPVNGIEALNTYVYKKTQVIVACGFEAALITYNSVGDVSSGRPPTLARQASPHYLRKVVEVDETGMIHFTSVNSTVRFPLRFLLDGENEALAYVDVTSESVLPLVEAVDNDVMLVEEDNSFKIIRRPQLTWGSSQVTGKFTWAGSPSVFVRENRGFVYGLWQDGVLGISKETTTAFQYHTQVSLSLGLDDYIIQMEIVERYRTSYLIALTEYCTLFILKLNTIDPIDREFSNDISYYNCAGFSIDNYYGYVYVFETRWDVLRVYFPWPGYSYSYSTPNYLYFDVAPKVFAAASTVFYAAVGYDGICVLSFSYYPHGIDLEGCVSPVTEDRVVQIHQVGERALLAIESISSMAEGTLVIYSISENRREITLQNTIPFTHLRDVSVEQYPYLDSGRFYLIWRDRIEKASISNTDYELIIHASLMPDVEFKRAHVRSNGHVYASGCYSFCGSTDSSLMKIDMAKGLNSTIPVLHYLPCSDLAQDIKTLGTTIYFACDSSLMAVDVDTGTLTTLLEDTDVLSLSPSEEFMVVITDTGMMLFRWNGTSTNSLIYLNSTNAKPNELLHVQSDEFLFFDEQGISLLTVENDSLMLQPLAECPGITSALIEAGTLYATNETALLVWDMTTLAQPMVVGQTTPGYTTEDTPPFEALAKIGDVLINPEGRMYDVTHPSQPRTINASLLEQNQAGHTISDELYIGRSAFHLTLTTMTNVAAPEVWTRVQYSDSMHDPLSFSEPYIDAVGYRFGLHRFDTTPFLQLPLFTGPVALFWYNSSVWSMLGSRSIGKHGVENGALLSTMSFSSTILSIASHESCLVTSAVAEGLEVRCETGDPLKLPLPYAQSTQALVSDTHMATLIYTGAIMVWEKQNDTWSFVFELSVLSNVSHLLALNQNILLVEQHPAKVLLCDLALGHASTPVAIDSFGSVTAAAFDNSTLYLADSAFGLRILRVTNPLSALAIGSYPTEAEHVNALQVNHSITFIGAGRMLWVLDCWDPASPELVQQYDAGSTIHDILLHNNRLFLALGDNGLRTLRPDGSPTAPWINTVILSGVRPLNEKIKYQGALTLLSPSGEHCQSTPQFTIDYQTPPRVRFKPSDQTVYVGEEVSLFIDQELTFTDADNDQLEVHVDNLPPWLTFRSQTSRIEGVVPSGSQGVWAISVVADDTRGGRAAATLTLYIANRSPQFGRLTDIVVSISELYVETFPFDFVTDLDNDPLTFTATMHDGQAILPWIHFNFSAGTVELAAPPGSQGKYRVTIEAQDPFNGVTETQLVVSVLNQAPTLKRVSDFDVYIGEEFNRTYPELWSDPDEDELLVSLTCLRGQVPTWMQFNAGYYTLHGLPLPGSQGDYPFRLVAQDKLGMEDSMEFTITVVNRPPQWMGQLPDKALQLEVPQEWTIPRDVIMDLDDDQISISAAIPQAINWLSFDTTALRFSGTPTSVVSSPARVTLIASDGRSEAYHQFGIIVEGSLGVNIEDVVISYTEDTPLTLPPLIITSPREMVSVSIILSNPDAGLLSTPEVEGVTADYKANQGLWEIDASQDVLNTMLERTEFAPTPHFHGSFTLELRAYDGLNVPLTRVLNFLGTSMKDQLMVGVPLPAQELYVGSTFVYDVPSNAIVNFDNVELSFQAELSDGTIPSWLETDSETGRIVVTIPTGIRGALNIHLLVKNIQNENDFIVLTLPLVVKNRAPEQVRPLSDQFLYVGKAWTYYIPSSTFRDSDGDVLHFSVQRLDGTALGEHFIHYIDENTMLHAQPTAADLGIHNILVSFSDGEREGNARLRVEVLSSMVVSQDQQSVTYTEEVEQLLPSLHVLTPQMTTTVSFTLSNRKAGSLSGLLPKSGGVFEVAGNITMVNTILDGGISFQPAKDFNEDFTIRIRVADGLNVPTEHLVYLQGINTNDVPILFTAVAAGSAIEEEAFSFIIPKDTFYDADGDELTYEVTLQDGKHLDGSPWSFHPPTMELSGTPPTSGSEHFLLFASDSSSTSDPHAFSVRIDTKKSSISKQDLISLLPVSITVSLIVATLLLNKRKLRRMQTLQQRLSEIIFASAPACQKPSFDDIFTRLRKACGKQQSLEELEATRSEFRRFVLAQLTIQDTSLVGHAPFMNWMKLTLLPSVRSWLLLQNAKGHPNNSPHYTRVFIAYSGLTVDIFEAILLLDSRMRRPINEIDKLEMLMIVQYCLRHVKKKMSGNEEVTATLRQARAALSSALDADTMKKFILRVPGRVVSTFISFIHFNAQLEYLHVLQMKYQFAYDIKSLQSSQLKRMGELQQKYKNSSLVLIGGLVALEHVARHGGLRDLKKAAVQGTPHCTGIGGFANHKSAAVRVCARSILGRLRDVNVNAWSGPKERNYVHEREDTADGSGSSLCAADWMATPTPWELNPLHHQDEKPTMCAPAKAHKIATLAPKTGKTVKSSDINTVSGRGTPREHKLWVNNPVAIEKPHSELSTVNGVSEK